MHVLIATSGGIDGIYLLYRTLEETNYEVSTVFFTDSPEYKKETNWLEYKCWLRCMKWLKKNCRTFEYYSSPMLNVDGEGKNLSGRKKQWTLPIREGFTNTTNACEIIRRHVSLAHFANNLGEINEVWTGHNLLNTKTDMRMYAHSEYYKVTKIPIFNPFMEITQPKTPKDLENGIGRFEIMDKTPVDLRVLTYDCATGNRCNSCNRCLFTQYYDRVVVPSQEGGRVHDQKMARLGCFGPYRNNASKDYKYSDAYKLFYKEGQDRWRRLEAVRLKREAKIKAEANKYRKKPKRPLGNKEDPRYYG